MPASRNSWGKLIPPPQSRNAIDIDRTYLAAEFERIKEGVIPRGMEDKWFVFYEEPWLYLHRSWTGFCIFQVRFASEAGSAHVSEALVNRDPMQWTEEGQSSDSLLLATLLDGFAGRNDEVAWEQYLASLSVAMDLAVWSGAKIELDRMLPEPDKWKQGVPWSFGRDAWLVTIFPQGEVDPRQIPESVCERLPGARHVVGVSLRAVGKSSAAAGRDFLEKVVRTLVRNSDGLWVDHRGAAFAADEGVFEFE